MMPAISTTKPSTVRAARTGRVLSRPTLLIDLARFLILVLLLIAFVGPFVWLAVTALKARDELATYPVELLPAHPQLQNFIQAVTTINFAHYAANSLILATGHAFLVTLSSAMVGFGFARLQGRGKRLLFMLVLSSMMLPGVVTLFPTYVIFARVGIVGTYWPWVLWGIAGSPYLIFLYRQFFTAIPAEIEDAAILDGCGYGRIFARIFLPLSTPALATAFLLSFMWVWGDYITPALLLDINNTTLAVEITTSYVDAHNNAIPNVQAAGSLLYMIPEMVIFFLAQRLFVRSIVTAGVKG